MKPTAPKRLISRRKSPSQKRSHGLVDALVEAATRVLNGSDLDKTSTNKIAEIAGASIGSLYQYFPNKESLATAVLERIVGNSIKFVEKVFQKVAQLEPDQIVDELIDYFFGFASTHRFLFKVLAKHVIRLSQQEVVITNRMKIKSLIAEMILKKTNLKKPEAEVVAWVTVMAFIGILESLSYKPEEAIDLESLRVQTKLMISTYLKEVLSGSTRG